MLMRLQKLLADSGVASRRKCEEIIRSGRVSVDGIIVTEMGFKADPAFSRVELDGRLVSIAEKKAYIALHKPAGYITTSREQLGRPAVMDLINSGRVRLFPVGRLDRDTSGLLLLTNDGDFAYKLTHPKHRIEKTYMATVAGIPSDAALKALADGIELSDGITAPARLRLAVYDPETPTVEITITEGRNRQVRRMFEAVGHKVLRLHRVSVGRVSLGGLTCGEHRHLSADEVKILIGDCLGKAWS